MKNKLKPGDKVIAIAASHSANKLEGGKIYVVSGGDDIGLQQGLIKLEGVVSTIKTLDDPSFYEKRFMLLSEWEKLPEAMRLLFDFEVTPWTKRN